ncbi:hypothetical protein C8R44DRAFT_142974 [Mycena epipterygia]|nr:hypothetical protein C8R44DRAFT_142974 [Mycena epipterygia]
MDGNKRRSAATVPGVYAVLHGYALESEGNHRGVKASIPRSASLLQAVHPPLQLPHPALLPRNLKALWLLLPDLLLKQAIVECSLHINVVNLIVEGSASMEDHSEGFKSRRGISPSLPRLILKTGRERIIFRPAGTDSRGAAGCCSTAAAGTSSSPSTASTVALRILASARRSLARASAARAFATAASLRASGNAPSSPRPFCVRAGRPTSGVGSASEAGSYRSGGGAPAARCPVSGRDTSSCDSMKSTLRVTCIRPVFRS